ncbi:hypothetical protein OHB00_49380 [Streptomyces sp. NBC_00631]
MSGMSAIGTAMDLLRAGRWGVALAAVAESARCTDLASASRLFDTDRAGFVLDEEPPYSSSNGPGMRGSTAG